MDKLDARDALMLQRLCGKSKLTSKATANAKPPGIIGTYANNRTDWRFGNIHFADFSDMQNGV